MTRRLRIATYNVQNFFSARHPRHPKKPRECRALAQMVEKIDADILGLQEVENVQALAELNERLANPYEHYGLLEGNSNRGINVAFMSRLPFDLTSHRQTTLTDEDGARLTLASNDDAARSENPMPAGFQRDLLLARFNGSDPPIAVFNTHLKSRNPHPGSADGSDRIRSAEARAIHEIVSAYERHHPHEAIVLLGDFNERHEHSSLRPIMALAYADPVLNELIPHDATLSTHSSHQRDRIDYVLLGPCASARHAPNSTVVYREAMARKASDHYPVSVVLEL